MSGKRYFLDTNIIIDLFRGDKAVYDFFQKHSNLAIPVIVIGELMYGAENSSHAKKHIQQVSDFISQVETIEINEETAVFYGKIKSQLKIDGKPIPENDIWIAAISAQHKVDLVTNDKHFKNVKSLKVKEISN